MAKEATFSPDPVNPVSTTGSCSPILDKRGDQSYWPLIGTKDQIPGWLRDNDYIVGSHPMPTYSYRRSFRQWRCLHMETINIWTHLLGSTAFVTTGVVLYRYVLSSTNLHLTIGDTFAFGSFFTATTVCFGLSTTFHTLRSHSYNVHHFWGKMDILGICVLALGGGVSMTYYVFYRRPAIQRVYWGLNFGCAVAAAITLFDTGGGGSKLRTLRGGVFTLLALSAMLPLFHSAGLLGWDRVNSEIGAWWYIAEGLSLLLGRTSTGKCTQLVELGSFKEKAGDHMLLQEHMWLRDSVRSPWAPALSSTCLHIPLVWPERTLTFTRNRQLLARDPFTLVFSKYDP
ncbi:hypothetical protein B7463_g3280, partial [Scytalidium lignicola]